jgi:vacuolar-type H+-ATPase subunit H
MEEAKKNSYEDESPQQSLEKILKAENEITKEISAAKERAEKRIEEVQEEIDPLKIKIIEQARKDREEYAYIGMALEERERSQHFSI